MVVYRDHENYSDGYRMTMISTIPVAELIALHAEDEKRDRIAHRITIFPKNNIRGSLITGNEVFLGLSIFSVRGELQAIGNLRYQYRFYQDEAELAKLLIAELDRLALLPYPKQNTNAAPPSK